MNPPQGFIFIDPVAAKQRLDRGDAALIDIRGADEFARERIDGAHLAPLTAFEAHDFSAFAGKPVIVTCRMGARTVNNASRFLGRGFGQVLLLDGGIDAWKRAGLPVRTDQRVPIDLMRQVQIAAGTMVLAGSLLTVLSPWFALVPAFAGGGLIFAGTTGYCGMARLLKHMPWNRALAQPAA